MTIYAHIRSNLIAYVALFVALGGTSAWAATELSKNEVKSKHIDNGQVKNADLADDAVTATKVANGTLLGEDFASGQLPQGPPGPPGPPGTSGSPDTPEQVLDKIKQVDGESSGLDADTLDGLGAGSFARSGQIIPLNFVSPDDLCYSATAQEDCVMAFFATEGNFRLTTRCDVSGTNARLRVTAEAVDDPYRTINFNAVSGATASQGGFGRTAGTVLTLEGPEKAAVGNIVMRTYGTVITITYQAYAVWVGSEEAAACQFVGNAVRTG